MAQQLTKLEWIAKTGAKKFPSSKKIFSVNDYGAVSDTVTVISSFIQKAIDDCAAKGGGIVTFKPGTYVTGSIFLKTTFRLLNFQPSVNSWILRKRLNKKQLSQKELNMKNG
jgi:polygalacturonase